MSRAWYRSCAVPECRNTIIKTPNKLWIPVPTEKNRRETWLKLAGRDGGLAAGYKNRSQMFYCEDHFDLENDMINYRRYKSVGYTHVIKLKPDCIPTRFKKNNNLQNANTKQIKNDSKEYNIKIKQERDDRECNSKLLNTFEDKIKTECELYRDHIIKEEIDIGLEVIQDSEINSVSTDVADYVNKNTFACKHCNNDIAIETECDLYQNLIKEEIVIRPEAIQDFDINSVSTRADRDNKKTFACKHCNNDMAIKTEYEELYRDHIIKDEIVNEPEMMDGESEIYSVSTEQERYTYGLFE